MVPEIRYTRTTDQVRIAYASTGSGDALLALPGAPFGDLAGEWRIPSLRRAYLGLTDRIRLVQYDNRGSGHSQRDVDDVSLDALLLDLVAVLDAAEVDACVLLGFYHSCAEAIAFAARHPARIRGLVLFGGSTRGWELMQGPGTQALLSLIDRDWDTFVESAAHAWLGWPAGEEGRLAADWLRTATTPDLARRVMREFSAIDVTEEARRVEADSIVLHRRDGPVIPLEVSEALATSLPGGRLRMIDGSSAGLWFERPDEITRILVAATLGHPIIGDLERRAADGRSGLELTRRETEVLRLIASGSSNAEIGVALGISIHTVERHVSNVYRKIDARGRADATAFAIRRGIA
jgi:pimeloyl-ACP methyl ester carboxylesterase/DNA-binding CsgD family transcriptional regulator